MTLLRTFILSFVFAICGMQVAYSLTAAQYSVMCINACQAQTGAGTQVYGMAITGDDLANSALGGSGGNPQSMRFRATQSSTITSATFYYVVGGAGYGAGTGGTWTLGIETDDGTANHFPSGIVLGAAQSMPALGSVVTNGGLQVNFTTPATVVAGQLYHLVFTNTDAGAFSSSLTTNGTTATSSATLHFASVPAGVNAGQTVTDSTTPGAITGSQTILSTTGTTVVLSANVNATVGSGDSIAFSGNYFSPDYLWSNLVDTAQAISAAGTPNGQLHPKYPVYADLTHLWYTGGVWQVGNRVGLTPILDIGYANGQHQGMDYFEASRTASNQGQISGASDVARETFTNSGPNIVVYGVGVRAIRITGSNDPLVATLSLPNGANVETVSIPSANIAVGASAVGGGYGREATWAYAPFPHPYVILSGSTYNLVFSTASTSTYWMWVMRKANINFAYGAADGFADGNAQSSQNAGATWTSVGNDPGQNDYMFYLQR
jgi:hypothetical protein